MQEFKLKAICHEAATRPGGPFKVKITYNDLGQTATITERVLEPYSTREKDLGLVFYGYETNPPSGSVSHDPGIKMFYIDLIDSITITGIPFTPRWPVEF